MKVRLKAPDGWIGLAVLVFVAVLILVDRRAVAGLDAKLLRALDVSRPTGLVDEVNWIFRLGFAQVDLAGAAIWSILLLARRRGPQAAVRPLLLFLVVGVEAGLRLVVNQPAPDATYALSRTFADHPVSSVLDQTDEATRQSFARATTGIHPIGAALARPDRGSFPSGHAARAAYLALVAWTMARPRPTTAARARWATSVRRASWLGPGALALLVGYSVLYFGYHWPSDVVAGYLLGVAGWRLVCLIPERSSIRTTSPVAAASP